MNSTAATCQVSAIIVSYNTRDLTLTCLAKLTEALHGIDSEIIVVDNASVDGTVAAVRAAYPAVTILEPGQNLGFGVANNLAMKSAKGDTFLLVNSDAFMPPGSVQALLAALARHPNAALVGPRLLYEDGSLQPSCYRFPTATYTWLENLWITTLVPPRSALGDYRRWKHDAECEVDWLIGACMLVRRSAYERAGGFDPRFFMYAEETDWQRTLRDHGFTIVFTPATDVIHLAGGSGKTEKAKIRTSFFDSLDLYILKHHGRLGFFSMRLAMTVGLLMRSIAWLIVWLFRLRPADFAAAKIKLCLWLLRRQTSDFHLLHVAHPGGRQ